MLNRTMMRPAAGVFLALCGAAYAETPDRATIAGWAGACAACHGPDGHSPGPMPSIAGQKSAYLEGQMLAFRDGREPSTIMARLMRGYEPDQIAALAQWFSEIDKEVQP